MLLLATHNRYPVSVSTIDESVRSDCHLGNTHKAYRFGSLAVVVLTLGSFFSKSLGDTHPASNATANAPTNNFMQVTPVESANHITGLHLYEPYAE